MNSSTLTAPETRPSAIPPGFHTLTPYLACTDAAAAIRFYSQAFGAVELVTVPRPDGKLLHACIRIGDSHVMLMEEIEGCAAGPKTLGGTPVSLHLYVANADESARRAEKAGAKVLMPVQEMFWGDRYGLLEDPFGHRWAVATHVRDVTPDELRAAAAQACG